MILSGVTVSVRARLPLCDRRATRGGGPASQPAERKHDDGITYGDDDGTTDRKTAIYIKTV